jgi:ribosomal-protein-alanine N-acetyltransferase
MTRIETERLVLRPWKPEDAPALQRIASAKEIADGLISIPHPYPDGAAADWIATADDKSGLRLAIVRRSDGALVGSIALSIEAEHRRAEAGYFVGVEHWGRGYATEALLAVLAHGFEELGLNRIYAHHFLRNPASGRVLEKAGMRREGIRHRHTFKDGEYLDSAVYALLRSENEADVR